jgi:hypothetical protein
VTAVENAWQAALAAEHQALFGYAVLGPHLNAGDRALAYRCVDEHETLRDDTMAALTAAGQTPVAPLPDYPALYPVTSAASARQLAARLEDECARAWRYLYLQAAGGTSAGQPSGASAEAGASSGSPAAARPLRRSAQAALTASAVRATRWRVLIDPQRPAAPFPGL